LSLHISVSRSSKILVVLVVSKIVAFSNCSVTHGTTEIPFLGVIVVSRVLIGKNKSVSSVRDNKFVSRFNEIDIVRGLLEILTSIIGPIVISNSGISLVFSSKSESSHWIVESGIISTPSKSIVISILSTNSN